jgi:hypothetical protein
LAFGLDADFDLAAAPAATPAAAAAAALLLSSVFPCSSRTTPVCAPPKKSNYWFNTDEPNAELVIVCVHRSNSHQMISIGMVFIGQGYAFY